jgi:hypothetical protein
MHVSEDQVVELALEKYFGWVGTNEAAWSAPILVDVEIVFYADLGATQLSAAPAVPIRAASR